MQEHLLPDVETGKALDRAVIARHRNMSHALSRLLAEAGGDQLIVAPHRAVEEDQRRAVEPLTSDSSVTRAQAAMK